MPAWFRKEWTADWPAQLRGPWRKPLRSLPSRIAFFVFAATLVTSLLVTGISTNSTAQFLRQEVDQKFPSLLNSVGNDVAHWYEQRNLEINVFANSHILRETVPDLSNKSGRREDRARREVEQYLSYVLDGFPQYEALFVLRPGGTALWVGAHEDLLETLRDSAEQRAAVRIEDVRLIGDRRVQVASAPVADLRGNAAGTLYALLRLEALDELLVSPDLGPRGEIFLVDAGSRYVAPRPRIDPNHQYERPLPEPDAAQLAEDYFGDGGERVVGSARRLARFGWTLVVEEPYGEVFAPVVSAIQRVLVINLAIVLLFGLAAYRIARSIAKPIEGLSGAARRISEGERNVTIPESRASDEVALLTRAFNQMSARLAENAEELESSRREVEEANQQLQRQNDELQRVNEVLEQLSITDGLTRLHNHRFFQDYLAKEVKRADRSNEPLALVLIDVDHFKRWNERVGHAGGDEILRGIADVMNSVIRETDLLARYGGEEFAVLAPNTELSGAVRLAEKIRSAVSSAALVDLPSEQDPVTVSIGVACYRGDRVELFNDADKALYRAKSGGRDCVVASEATKKKRKTTTRR